MPLPEGYDYLTYTSELIGQINDVAVDLRVLKKYWIDLSDDQKEKVKDTLVATLDAVIENLAKLKEEIAAQ